MRDAVTGEDIDRISSTGIDYAAALDYGRRVGGPALRELTFHQRAALLKALGTSPREQPRRALAQFPHVPVPPSPMRASTSTVGSACCSPTPARRSESCPTTMVYVIEGAIELLGRAGTFVGQHILTPRLGVAVQINAFNFPVWGPLEKLAPAVLAGVPSFIKPASPTAFLTRRLVELIIEAGILPAGTLQAVAGSAGDLLDHLGEQDLLAFTGSASTAARLRAHPTVVNRAVRFSAEADLLNCSILGPDAAPGTPEFDLYVDALVTEMTAKTGPKRTAIRRAFVPATQLDAVTEAVAQRLAAVVVGDPTDPAVRMGPLVGLEQREQVRRSLKSLSEAGRIVFGDAERVEVVGADAQRGAFLSPVLLRCDDVAEPAPHEVEAFGPVSTLLPYTSSEQVIELAARGAGSLVASVVTADTDFARCVVLGLAPWHGRILVLDRDDAAENTGHGSPLPAAGARRAGSRWRR